MSEYDHLLTREEVAGRCGWSTPGTVSRYLAWTRQRTANGETLTPQDFPLPARMIGRTPLWEPEAIDRWLRARPGRGRGPTQETDYMHDVRATSLREGDTTWINGQRLVVREIRPEGTGVRVRVARSRRETGRWRSLNGTTTFAVLRPIEREQ